MISIWKEMLKLHTKLILMLGLRAKKSYETSSQFYIRSNNVLLIADIFKYSRYLIIDRRQNGKFEYCDW